MTGVSLYRDGLALDPPLSSCAGCTTAEPEIRSLLDHITNSFLNNPAKFLGFGLPKLEAGTWWELFHHWVQKFEVEANSDPRFPMCPDLKKRIEALVYKLMNERYGLKRKRETVEDVLAFLKCLAADPFDQMREAPEGWVDEVLRARKALSPKDVEVNNAGDVPSRDQDELFDIGIFSNRWCAWLIEWVSNHGNAGASFGDYFIRPGLDMLLYHLAENDPNRYGTPPAKKEAIYAMPTTKIKENLNYSVCLDDFEIGTEAREMPCSHKL